MRRIPIGPICAALVAGAPLYAGVTVGFDAPTLNELLPAIALQEITVPLAGGASLRVELEDLEVVGFAPSGGAGPDHILTSLRLRVPAFGLDLALEPKMALGVVAQDGQSVLELRFVEVAIPIPLAGSVDASPFLAPLRFPADDVFLIAGTRGDVQVRSRLSKIEMGTDAVRFEFDLEVIEPGLGEAAHRTGS